MSLQIYSFSQARARISQSIEERRAELPASCRSRQRKRPDGTTFTEYYLVGASLLSDGAEKTLWALGRLALKGAEQVLRVPLLAETYQVVNGQLPAPPPVATNCEALCKAHTRGRRVSGRTIRNHLTELLRAGYITKKQFRGRQENFYVWISPELVWKTTEKAVEKPASALFQQAVETAWQGATGTNFPPNLEQATRTTNEIETGDGDKLVPHEARGGATGFTGHTAGYTGAQQGAEPGQPGPEKATGGAAARVSDSGPPPVPAPATRPKKRLTDWQADMVHECLTTAWRELYAPRGQNFTQDEQRKALNAIYDGVYFGFDERWEQLTPHQQQRYHDQVLERLGLAAAYFRRNPTKYPPLPWAEYVPGAGYFDAANERGFVKTLDWHEQQLRHRLERATAEGLRRARRVFTQHYLGRATKTYQQKSTLELYRYFEKKFQQLGQPALHRFKIHFDAPPVVLAPG